MDLQEGMISESTISTESTEGSTPVNTDATEPQEQQEQQGAPQGEAETSPNAESEEVVTPFLTIRHNHEDKQLTQDEATVFAQKGMAYDTLYGQIARAAAIQGKDVKEFIASFEKMADDQKRRELMEQYGGDAGIVDQMMELYQIKKEQTVSEAERLRKQAEEAETQNVNQRLADEFIELKKVFPDLKGFDSLPEQVKRAAGAGMSLEHAYLKYQHTETKKVADAQKAADTAADKSTGSMGTDNTSQETIAEQKYRAALWG